ncbi:DUF3341 domain-containing protein [Myxococcus xanthus]|uniref:DUF3341 domain-containing protein n=1 Tax=Myxococcus xanthus TaxID=34 RepID=A0A7Y4MV16_MYXXA|nr:DUF3341 domain-containing protein [Myxococcus xanthus]NOJ82183.1 DUF3341 domain-containing protein [Myxococcus xanthus]NOJ89472.1 DUF3341 domain-containing protein [Myxococcus xanthus]
MSRWVLGEFRTPERMVAAARALRASGFLRLEAHTPYPVEDVDAVLGLSGSRLPLLALLAGVGGAAGAYVVQWFTQAVDWPLNVGGRPLHSGPAFIPITFESAVLAAAGAIFLGVIVACGLPRVTHPFLDLEAFRSASIDGFWLAVAVDGSEGVDAAEGALRQLGAAVVLAVEGRR